MRLFPLILLFALTGAARADADVDTLLAAAEAHGTHCIDYKTFLAKLDKFETPE